MKDYGALLLLCIVSSSVAKQVRNPDIHNAEVLHHAADISDLRHACLCPTRGSGLRVSDLLNKQNTNLQRVVVFFYKDKANNDVYMYTPSREKQLFIPELEIGVGDDIHKVHNPVSLLPFQDNPVDEVIDSPIFIEYPESNYNQYLDSNQIWYPESNQNQHLDSNQIWSPESSQNQHIIQHVNSYQNQYPYSLHTQYLTAKSPVNKLPPQHPNLDNYSSWYLTHSGGNEHTWHMPNSANIDEKYTIQLPPNTYKDNYKIIYNKKYKIDPEYNKYVFGNYVEDSIHGKNTSYSFNKWYSDHAAQFPEIYSRDPQYLNFDDLKEQVLHLFSGHGYSVINNQLLDEHGEAIKANNHKLVRVRIQEYDDDQLLLSDDVEGIMLIDLLHSNILGVIPLNRKLDEINHSSYIMKDDKVLYGNAKVGLKEKADIAVNSVKQDNVHDALLNLEAKDTETTTTVTTEAPEATTSNKPRNLQSLLTHFAKTVNRLMSPRRKESEMSVPDFRIIGGNAATGSGAPISSRGRSAAPTE